MLGKTEEENALDTKGLTQVVDSKILDERDSIRKVVQETTSVRKTIQAVILVGFYYVTGTPSTGLVISDVEGDDDNNSKGRNQFVWVPCNGDDQNYYTKLLDTKDETGNTITGDPIDQNTSGSVSCFI